MNKPIATFKDLYYDLYGVVPVINYAQCTKLINERLKDYSEDIICKIIKIYFENESKDQVFHLPMILSAYSFNKYLPRLNQKLNPNYENSTHRENNSEDREGVGD